MSALRPSALGVAIALLIAGLGSGCVEKTGTLTPERLQALETEGIVRRADDLIFRFTHGSGTRDAGWEDRTASIVVTRERVYIHKNEKVGLELTPRTRRYVQVRRDGQRIRITAGAGRSAESWSFVPPADATGWARDIRAVIHRPAPLSP
ncbi:MAG: hypothetical protein ACREMX_03100 [Gemmatimonadales bacterium]